MGLAVAALLVAVPAALAADPQGKPPPGSPADPPGVVRMSAEQQKTVKIGFATATRQAITAPVRVPGTVGYDPGRVALLRPFGQARVVRVLVQAGEVVAAGQAVAEIEMPALATAQQDLAAATASVREADAGVAVARDSLHRGEVLARDGSLARAEAERRRLVLAQAVAASETTRARVSALQAQLRQLSPAGAPGIARLVSPIGGVVATIGVTPGEVVDASREAVMVADLSAVLVLAQVPEANVSQVAVNDPAKVTLPSGGRSWDGRISALGAALDPQARTLPARITLANPDRALRIGMYVSVTITDELGRDAVVVPSAAVQRVADKQVVFTPLDGDRFQSHEVTPGVENTDAVELRGPAIPAGSRVVTQGSFELKALLQQSMSGGG